MKSLRARIVVGCAAIQLALLVVTGVLVFRLIERELFLDVDQLLKDKVVILSKSLNRQNPMEVWPSPKEMERDRLGFYCQGWGADRKFLWKTKALPAVIPLSTKAADYSWFYRDFVLETVETPGLGEVRMATYPVWHMVDGNPQIFAYVQCVKPLAESRRQLGDLWVWIAGGGVVMLALGTLLTNTLVGRWLASMSTVAQTAQAISGQALLSQRIPVPNGDPEVAELASAFNQMLDRLDHATSTQQRFLADASHELRTPLTILRGEIEVALRRDRSSEEYRDVLVSNREEIERLSRMAENLLMLARVDAGGAFGSKEVSDLGEVSRRVAQRMEALETESGAAIHVVSPEPAPVLGDPLALERMVTNLVENAVRHSPRDEVVQVSVSAQNGEVRLEVSDRGRGIPAEHLPHLFDRFYRVDVARNSVAGGAGLGLAIVRSLVEAHGGKVTATSEIGKGSSFTVWLPKVDEQLDPAG